jgi:magnesium-protoporphyrin O-methyltransferase
MTTTASYHQRRGEIESYFDRHAFDAWKRLTSDAPVGRIRATVRAGRDQMRDTLLDWLPEDLSGLRLLDAGCGTGALAVEAARRGADVLGVDVSPSLVEIAKERTPDDLDGGRVRFEAGDMLDEAHGEFDYVVAMDSLIHYCCCDVVGSLAGLAARTRKGILFTFAPRTPMLATMHSVGRFFPRGDRAPAIEPVAEERLRRLISAHCELRGWRPERSERISSGFYTSQAMELRAQPTRRKCCA